MAPNWVSPFICVGAVRRLAGLITQRSQVQILTPQQIWPGIPTDSRPKSCTDLIRSSFTHPKLPADRRFKPLHRLHAWTLWRSLGDRGLADAPIGHGPYIRTHLPSVCGAERLGAAAERRPAGEIPRCSDRDDLRLERRLQGPRGIQICHSVKFAVSDV